MDEVVDRTAVLALVSGDLTLLRELIEMFTPEYFKRLVCLQEAIAEKDAAGLRISAHGIKSLVGNFYAWRAHDLAAELEQMGQRLHFETAREVSERLESEVRAMRLALDRLILETVEERKIS